VGAFSTITFGTDSMVVNAVNTLTLTLTIAGYYVDGDVLTVSIPATTKIEFTAIGTDVSNCQSVS
jgi:hypothetical protein